MGRIPGLPQGAAETAEMPLPGTCFGPQNVSRKIRSQVFPDADRSNPGAASAVGNTEGLVQVQMSHVGTELCRPTNTELRIEVSPVQIYLSPVSVYDVTDFTDLFFKDAVSGRVGDHEGSQPVGVFPGLSLQVSQINVALPVTGHHDNSETRHGSTGRIGAVGGARDQTDISLAFIAFLMVAPDHEQTSVLALRPGIGLQRNSRKTSHDPEHLLQLVDELEITGHLFERNKRVHLSKSRLADRKHLSSGVQLHCAGTERDH